MKAEIKWAHCAGSVQYGVLEVSFGQTVPDMLAYGRSTRPRPNLMLVYDVSGSMMKNMDALHAVSKATLDLLPNGSKFCALAFDSMCQTIVNLCTLDDAVKSTARATISQKLVNLRRSTDISYALSEAYKVISNCNEPFNVILLTDGCATRGVTGSASLRTMVEHQLNNFNNLATVHCIGLRNEATDHLNAGFLSDLALDSAGAFHLIEDKMQVAECLGDTLSSYYLTVCEHVKVSGAKVLSRMPTKGFSVLMDKPLKIVISVEHGIKGVVQVTWGSGSLSVAIEPADAENMDAKLECYKVLALRGIDALTKCLGKRTRDNDDLVPLLSQMKALGSTELEQIIRMVEQALEGSQDLGDSADYQAFMTSMSLNRASVGMGAVEEASDATLAMRAEASLSSQANM